MQLWINWGVKTNYIFYISLKIINITFSPFDLMDVMTNVIVTDMKTHNF